MAKLYVMSDIHGFYNEMREALDNAGFDPNDENSWVVVCGDCFDRGPKAVEVMKYLMGLPRKVIIKGNHEQLLLDCCNRGEAWGHDISNGTADSVWQFGEGNKWSDFSDCCTKTLARTHVFLSGMVNYFETERFVFCHGFLPVTCDDTFPPYYRKNRRFSKMENWREANQRQWDDAMWLNSYDMIEQGFGIEKCVVAGHFHTSYGRYMSEGKPEFGPNADFSPFYYGNKLIMIDGCTAYTGKVNVLVIEDEFLTTQN